MYSCLCLCRPFKGVLQVLSQRSFQFEVVKTGLNGEEAAGDLRERLIKGACARCQCQRSASVCVLH